jgi:hypothetical protein
LELHLVGISNVKNSTVLSSPFFIASINIINQHQITPVITAMIPEDSSPSPKPDGTCHLAPWNSPLKPPFILLSFSCPFRGEPAQLWYRPESGLGGERPCHATSIFSLLFFLLAVFSPHLDFSPPQGVGNNIAVHSRPSACTSQGRGSVPCRTRPPFLGEKKKILQLEGRRSTPLRLKTRFDRRGSLHPLF